METPPTLASLLGPISHEISFCIVGGPPAGGGSLRGELVAGACRDLHGNLLIGVDFIDIRPHIIEPHVRDQTPLGLEFLAHMAKQKNGGLQPNTPIAKGLAGKIIEHHEKGVRQIVLRGYPRNTFQAEELISVGAPIKTVLFQRDLEECKRNFNNPSRRAASRDDDAVVQQLVGRFENTWLKETLPALKKLRRHALSRDGSTYHERKTPPTGPDLAADILFLLQHGLTMSTETLIQVIANLANNEHPAGQKLRLCTEEDRRRTI